MLQLPADADEKAAEAEAKRAVVLQLQPHACPAVEATNALAARPRPGVGRMTQQAQPAQQQPLHSIQRVAQAAWIWEAQVDSRLQPVRWAATLLLLE